MKQRMNCILCGAFVRVEQGADVVTCPYCQTEMDVIDVEGSFVEAEIIQEKQTSCILCGARLQVPKEAKTATCPYCQTEMDIVDFEW